MAVIAQHERKMISVRTITALAAAKAWGKRLGNVNGAAAPRRAGKGNVAAVGEGRAQIATLPRSASEPGYPHSRHRDIERHRTQTHRAQHPEGQRRAVVRHDRAEPSRENLASSRLI